MTIHPVVVGDKHVTSILSIFIARATEMMTIHPVVVGGEHVTSILSIFIARSMSGECEVLLYKEVLL